MNHGDREDALGQLLKHELEGRARANTWCSMIFAVFVAAMVALVGLVQIVDETKRIILCFAAMALVVGWTELQSHASDTVNLHDERIEEFERDLALSARFLPVRARPWGILGRWRSVRTCAVMAWAPALSFVGWLLALFQLSR